MHSSSSSLPTSSCHRVSRIRIKAGKAFLKAGKQKINPKRAMKTWSWSPTWFFPKKNTHTHTLNKFQIPKKSLQKYPVTIHPQNCTKLEWMNQWIEKTSWLRNPSSAPNNIWRADESKNTEWFLAFWTSKYYVERKIVKFSLEPILDSVYVLLAYVASNWF